MTRRMQLLGPEERPSASRLAAMAARIRGGLPEGWARGDRAVPAVLTVLALLIFAWIAAGAFIGGIDPNEEASSPASIAQAPGGPESGGSGTTPAPGVEDGDADSYAAYDEPKDPFCQIIPKAGEEGGNESTNGGDACGGGDRDQGSDTGGASGGADRGSADRDGNANRDSNANRGDSADRGSNADRGGNADRDSNADRGSNANRGNNADRGGGIGDEGGVDGGGAGDGGGGPSSDGDEGSTDQPSPGGPDAGGGIPGQDSAGNLFSSGGDLELP